MYIFFFSFNFIYIFILSALIIVMDRCAIKDVLLLILLYYIFFKNNVTMATMLGISLSLQLNIYIVNGTVKSSHSALADNVKNNL